MPEVSVIIPVYNCEKYISACLESVLAQSFTDFEVIIVNDGSTDDSQKICAGYETRDTRIVIITQKNSGQGAARNTGIKNASGRYILFADADDTMEKDLLEKTVSAAEKTDSDIVFFDAVAVDENGTRLYDLKHQLKTGNGIPAEDDKRIIFTLPCPWNRLIKRTMFTDDLMFPTDTWYEDLRCMSKLCAEAQTYSYIGDILYRYTIREGSTIRNGNSSKTVHDRILSVNDIYEYFGSKGLMEKYSDELEWIIIFHGFFLGAREIIHFDDYKPAYVRTMKANMKNYTRFPKKNKYYGSLSKKEKLIFNVLYYTDPRILKKIK